MRRAVCAALLVAGLLLSSGCATPPNAAFMVDGEVTTGQEMEGWVEACARAFQQEPHEVRLKVFDSALGGRIAARILVANGIQYSNTEREELLLKSVTGTAMLRDPICQQVGYGMADYALLMDQLGMEKFIAAQDQVVVVLNPRYGYWDPTSASVIGNGSLSEVAETR